MNKLLLNLTSNVIPVLTSNTVPNPTVPIPSTEPVVIQDDIVVNDLKLTKKEADRFTLSWMILLMQNDPLLSLVSYSC